MKIFLRQNLLLVPFGFDSKKWEKAFLILYTSVFFNVGYKYFFMLRISLILVGLNIYFCDVFFLKMTVCFYCEIVLKCPSLSLLCY